MSFNPSHFQETIFSEKPFNFKEKAIELFHFQYNNNLVYQEYCHLINCNPSTVKSINSIPFLPISSFKNFQIKTTEFQPEITFSSSGTTGSTTSKHYVKNLETYYNSFLNTFNYFYTDISEYTVMGLLPSYLEREGSSLILMVDEFIKRSNSSKSGFFLNNQNELVETLKHCNERNEKVLLIGVSFALLDLVENFELTPNPNLIVMETGGMKGRRKELIREELHAILKTGFQAKQIHSEYGMTELLSQAYSHKNGLFNCPPWMKVVLRKQDDPLQVSENTPTGAINVIDLANIYSCAFIATDDLGKLSTTGEFEVLGRFDSSDVRGCNLLVS